MLLCFLKVDGQNVRKGKEEALTLWINPAEWMYCWTGDGVGQEDGGRREERGDIKETGVNSAVHHISPCLKGDCFCLSHGNRADWTAGLAGCWTDPVLAGKPLTQISQLIECQILYKYRVFVQHCGLHICTDCINIISLIPNKGGREGGGFKLK